MPEIFLIMVEAARRTDMGLILLPPVSGKKHHYDKVERIKVETPMQTVLECDAMFGSHLSFVPSKSFYISRKMSTYLNALLQSGLVLDRLIESEPNPDLAREQDLAPERWYSIPRAQFLPTTFIVKAHKPK